MQRFPNAIGINRDTHPRAYPSLQHALQDQRTCILVQQPVLKLMVGRVNLHVYAAEEIHAKFGVLCG